MENPWTLFGGCSLVYRAQRAVRLAAFRKPRLLPVVLTAGKRSRFYFEEFLQATQGTRAPALAAAALVRQAAMQQQCC